MRTTIAMDDEAFAIAKKYAKSRSLRFGKAVSELVRRGAGYRCPTREANGFIMFDPGRDSPTVTNEQVLELEEEWP